MGLEWEQLVVDARDSQTLGRWWAEALGWIIVYEDEDEVEIRATEDSFPGILFGNDSESKAVKNRLHFDFRPDDRTAEVERLLALGTERVEIGQTGEEPWVVLADPEGNEFCVLSSRRG